MPLFSAIWLLGNCKEASIGPARNAGRTGANRDRYLKAIVAFARPRSLLAGSARLALSGLVRAASMLQAAGPEVTKAILGYIALTGRRPADHRQGKGLFENTG